MDKATSHDEAGEPQGLKARFPGYFPPDGKEVERIVKGGLVAFDTNALFDLYRFNDQARDEYFASIRLLEERLWIPNRVAEELLERRLDVIRECSNAVQKLMSDLEGPFTTIRQQIRAFGNRRGLSNQEINDLESQVPDLNDSLSRSAKKSFPFRLRVDSSLKTDPILQEIESLVDGKIGPPLPRTEEEHKEGLRRIAAEVPPGYADYKKQPEQAVGDYFIWRQLIMEASRRGIPVLLVTNDKKPDWVREYQGKTIGPRPELVAEMLKEAGQVFHLVGVQTFLLYARKYLGATVSEATVRQAEQLNIDYELLGKFATNWARLEQAISSYVYHFTGERSKNITGMFRRFEILAELSEEECDRLRELRKFRNRVVHSGDLNSEDMSAIADSLNLLDGYLSKARDTPE